MSETETRYCSGCGQEKPLQQFQVTKENADGTTWVKTRKWCLACCKALADRQEASAAKSREVSRRWAAKAAERKRALGPLPPWVDPDALDYLVNGPNFPMQVIDCGRTQRETRAKQMLLLWGNFQKHERAVGEPWGLRGNRFIKAMADILKDDEVKFRQKLRRMCKHAESLLGIFETAPEARRRPPRKLRVL